MLGASSNLKQRNFQSKFNGAMGKGQTSHNITEPNSGMNNNFMTKQSAESIHGLSNNSG